MESELSSRLDVQKPSRNYVGIIVKVLLVLDLAVLGIMLTYAVYNCQTNLNTQKAITSPIDHLAEEFADSLPYSLLPDSFAVNTSYRNPATDQKSRGTCWAWSILYILETQYRAQGIAKGYLNPNEYVKFSVQAFAATLGNFCIAHPTEKVCGYGKFLQGSTNDNQIEALPYFIKAIPGLTASIVPDSVCNYTATQDPVTDFQCDNFEIANKSNPIRFSLQGSTTVYDTRGIKQLLFTKKRPLGIGTPLGTIDYIVKCSDPKYANLDMCTNKTLICPDSQTQDEYCAVQKFEGRTYDGTFVGIDTPDRQSEYGGHAMNIVGYNDNWQYLNRISGPTSAQNSRGAFILHNSWRADGHSIDYLLGNRTLENEQTSCPNHKASTSWIPATLECVQTNRAHPELCSNDIKRVRGHNLTNGMDILKCTSQDTLYCNYSNYYVLQRKEDSEDVDVYELENGLHSIGMITWNDTTGEAPHAVRIETLPFWILDRYFTPVDPVENNAEECGFYALPYQVVENMRRRQWDLFDNFKSTDYDIVFEDSSYLRSSASSKYDTTWLASSTYTQEDSTFDGPIPFNLVY